MCTRVGNDTQVLDEISFVHAYSTVLKGNHVVEFINSDFDVQVLLSFEFFWGSDGQVFYFVESVRGVGDQFLQKDIFIQLIIDNDFHYSFS
jgi:hypothetical protein